VNKILKQPYECSYEVQKSHKNLSSFIKSGKNPSEVFDFFKETFYQMLFLINVFAIIPLHFSVPCVVENDDLTFALLLKPPMYAPVIAIYF
jgi:hypothetical protein